MSAALRPISELAPGVVVLARWREDHRAGDCPWFLGRVVEREAVIYEGADKISLRTYLMLEAVAARHWTINVGLFDGWHPLPELEE